MDRNRFRLLLKSSSTLCVLLAATFSVSCTQLETRTLIREINANRTKCGELIRRAEAKRAEGKRQNDEGQVAERKRSIEEAASLYGQAAKLLTESADKGDKVTALTTTDWYKTYFTLYSKWTRNAARLAASAQEELLIKNNGRPTDEQRQRWETLIRDINKENDTLVKQIAQLESDHHTVLVAH